VPGDGEWQVQVSRRDEYRAANGRGQSKDRRRQSAASGEVSETRYAHLNRKRGFQLDYRRGRGVPLRRGPFYVTATTSQADATYRLLTWFNAQ
jgi:hypothetical protein